MCWYYLPLKNKIVFFYENQREKKQKKSFYVDPMHKSEIFKHYHIRKSGLWNGGKWNKRIYLVLLIKFSLIIEHWNFAILQDWFDSIQFLIKKISFELFCRTRDLNFRPHTYVQSFKFLSNRCSNNSTTRLNFN